MNAVFRVTEFDAEGGVTSLSGSELVGPPPPGHLRWIDLSGQDEDQLELLRARFDFHPLAIEDCAHRDQRPKLEEYRDCLFLVTQGFACPNDKLENLNFHELHTFLGEGYLVTVHLEPLPAIENVMRRATLDASLRQRGAAFLYYLIVDRIVDDNFPVLDFIAEEIESIEETVWTEPQRRELERLFAVKRHLLLMRRVLSPQRDVFSHLSKRSDRGIGESTALYFRDVYDHLTRIHEALEVHRDLLANAQEAYLSAVSNRTNEVMKYLTLMSAIFLPLSFLVGFFGQNFRDLPGFPDWTNSDPLMFGVLGLCLLTPAVMLALFRRKRWL
jgi:magnesium transporter